VVVRLLETLNLVEAKGVVEPVAVDNKAVLIPTVVAIAVQEGSYSLLMYLDGLVAVNLSAGPSATRLEEPRATKEEVV
jgi:hypothetical protein